MAPLADGLKGRVDYFSALLSLQKGETGVAGKKFLNFVSSMPEHPLAPTALFEEARSWEEENPQMARRRYQAVITQYKRSEKVADAMVRIGVLYSKEKKHELAATALLKYLEMFPNSEIAPKVHYKIAQSYFHAAKAKGSDELYQLAADKFIDLTKREGVASSLRIPSFYFAGESLLGCNRMGAARASFEKLILDWPESGWVKLARDRLNSKALKKPK
jgi:TolA-binding protein